MHNAPLPPPPPLIDGEDAETSSAALVSTGRIVPDSDLDMSTDLGEAVAHPPTLTLTPQPKSKLTTPMALDIPFPTHDASVVPIPRQPGLAHVRFSEFRDLTDPPPSFVCRCASDPTASLGSQALIALSRCGEEEARDRTSRATTEKKRQGEKSTARRD